MNQKVLPSLAIAAILFSPQTYAQKNTAFAVTAATKGTYTWNVLREIDLSNGEVLRTLYDPAVHKSINFKDVAGTELKPNAIAGGATGAGVAAAAYDAEHDRLYFTTMRGNMLMYADLATSASTIVVNDNPAFNTGNKADEANVITRMAFASDGFGYAITNDGKGFIRFTTGQKLSVTNLGPLIDGAKNGTVSVHAQATSWGGDVVGDAYGNLYLITYRNHVFRINPNSRIADYLGQLKGVSQQFTTNGVVVNNDGDLIVTSATQIDNYYRVNISTLDATPIQKKEQQVFNCSDLANGNLLYQNKTVDKLYANEVKGNHAVSVYPNPVLNKTFTVQFDKVPAGRYSFVLADASGKAVLAKPVTITMKGQVEKFVLPRTTASGMFMVKLTGGDSKVVYSDKLMVE